MLKACRALAFAARYLGMFGLLALTSALPAHATCPPSFLSTTIAADADCIFRDYVADGVSASGVYNPQKAQIRQWGEVVGNLTKNGLPGLSFSVEGGAPGLDMPGCTTVGTCAWEIFSSPTAYPAANQPTLFVTKVAPASGGAFGSTYSAIEAQQVTGLNDPGFQWAFQSVLHERTLASTLSQNVGMASSVFKELNGQAPGTQIGHYDAAFFGQCVDETAVANPTGSCQVAEFDVLTFVGAGTDNNKNRLGVQINGGVNNGTDTGVHIGTLLSLGAQNGAIIDTAFQVRDRNPTTVFQIFGNGGTQITSNFGGWSGVNVGKQFIVMPESNATVNPAIGISDLNSTNFIALENAAGTVIIEGMPALADTTSTPTVFAKFAAAGDALPNLPTSAGSGGLVVCVDVTGNLYKKSACP